MEKAQASRWRGGLWGRGWKLYPGCTLVQIGSDYHWLPGEGPQEAQARCPAGLGHPPGQVRECDNPFLFQKDCFYQPLRKTISWIFPLLKPVLECSSHISLVDHSEDAPAWKDLELVTATQGSSLLPALQTSVVW